MIRVLCYDDSGLSSTDVIKSCGTRVQPLQSVKPIRIAVSTVKDDWKGHTISVIINLILKRNDELKGDIEVNQYELWE
jgi:hypothetical protein